jgi:hypothetical protein
MMLHARAPGTGGTSVNGLDVVEGKGAKWREANEEGEAVTVAFNLQAHARVRVRACMRCNKCVRGRGLATSCLD